MGPCLHHYQGVRVYLLRTRSERVCETVTFFPHEIPFPEVKVGDFLKQAVMDITTILTAPPSTTYPTLQIGDPICNVLLTISQQLQRAEALPINKSLQIL